MKISMKSLFVVLAIVMSLVAVQSASAETISGTVESISTDPNVVVVEGVAISCVKLNYLCNQYNICLEEGSDVYIEYYVYTCLNGTVKNIATVIAVDDVSVTLR